MRRVIRTSVTIPKTLLDQVNKAAKAQGRNRSSYITWLVMQDLKRLSDNELKLTVASSDVTQ